MTHCLMVMNFYPQYHKPLLKDKTVLWLVLWLGIYWRKVYMLGVRARFVPERESVVKVRVGF